MRTSRVRRFVQAILILADTAVILGSIVLSYVIRILYVEEQGIELAWERISWTTPVVLLIHLVTIWLAGQYDFHRRMEKGRTLVSIFFAIVAAFAIMAAFFYFLPGEKIGRVVFTTHVVIAAVGVFVIRLLMQRLVIERTPTERILVLGGYERFRDLLAEIERQEYPPITIVGRYESPGIARETDPGEGGDRGKRALPFVGAGMTLGEVIEQERINRILVMPGAVFSDQIKQEIIGLKYGGVPVNDFVSLYAQLFQKLPLEALDDSWFVYADRTDFFQTHLFTRVKRGTDIGLAILGIVLASPLALFCAMAVKLNSPRGPVLFRQERLTQNKRPFVLYKFRTMVTNAEAQSGPTWASDRDPRIFFVGRIMRQLRLDELPQLINILLGDMSVVGPRPIRQHFADKMARVVPYYDLRFKVKPGLTGWAQVRHTYAGSIEEQVEKTRYDLYYVHSASFMLDWRIFLETVRTVLSRLG